MDRFAVLFYFIFFFAPFLFSFLDNTSSSPNTHASSLRSSTYVRVFPAGTVRPASDSDLRRRRTFDYDDDDDEKIWVEQTVGFRNYDVLYYMLYNNTPSRLALNGFVRYIHNWTDFRVFFTRDLCELINIAGALITRACIHIIS
jgi:hypothetical protein